MRKWLVILTTTEGKTCTTANSPEVPYTCVMSAPRVATVYKVPDSMRAIMIGDSVCHPKWSFDALYAHQVDIATNGNMGERRK